MLYDIGHSCVDCSHCVRSYWFRSKVVEQNLLDSRKKKKSFTVTSRCFSEDQGWWFEFDTPVIWTQILQRSPPSGHSHKNVTFQPTTVRKADVCTSGGLGLHQGSLCSWGFGLSYGGSSSSWRPDEPSQETPTPPPPTPHLNGHWWENERMLSDRQRCTPSMRTMSPFERQT